jgi:hypothetical protein
MDEARAGWIFPSSDNPIESNSMIKQSVNGLRRFRWGIISVLSLLAGFSGFAATVTTDHVSYATGEAIKVAFANGPGAAKDWIGLYKEGQTPGAAGVTSTDYRYVDGTQNGATGVANGEVTFGNGLSTTGNYVAYLLANDGYNILAQDKFTVAAATSPQVRVSKQSYAMNENIVLTFAHGPGNPEDSIAIYPEGITPDAGQPTLSKFLDGAGQTGVTDGTVTFTGGLRTPGNWVAYLLPAGDTTPIAQDTFTVALPTTGVATVIPDHQHYLSSQEVHITFDGGRGNTTDWVGVYALGQQNNGGANGFNSTDWAYVGGTQTPGAPLTSGEVVIGPFAPQIWRVYFLLNDGYEITGANTFEVVPDGTPVVQVGKRIYNVGEAISTAFFNAPGNAKDWIGIFPKGIDPSSTTATLWNYTDGTRTGTAGILEGTLDFPAGLSDQGEYTAYLFENDGYNVLSQEDFSVQASGVLAARFVSTTPADGGVSGPTADLKAVLENRDTVVDMNSIRVKLDGTDALFTKTLEGTRITVATEGTQVFAAGSAHSYTVSFKDSAGTTTTRTVNFQIGPYNTIGLPTPLFLETFDSTVEGSLPAGWTATNSSGTVLDPNGVEIPPDLHHLGSQAYNNFVVVNSTRLGGDFLTYGDATPETAPLAQILGPASVPTVVNGTLVRKYANGNILLGVSGYHGAGNEILEIVTPDYNLSGKPNIYLSFHSLLEQNQDSIEGIEVSNDGGTTWHPVVYYLDPPDIVKVNNVVDLDQTFNTQPTDAFQAIATFPDGTGGTYGSFLKAPIDAAAGAAIQPRLDNNPGDGTRVEYIRVPEADNKAAVRFRIFYAGSDSWYWGVDDFGIYSDTVVVDPDFHVHVSLNGSTITVTYDPSFTLQSTTELKPNAVWSPVTGAANGTYTTTATGTTQFFRALR